MSRTTLLIVLTALVAGLAGFGASRWLDARHRTEMASRVANAVATETRRAAPAVAIGELVPDRGLPDLGGEPRVLSEFAGQFVVVNFWATWCAPCREEIPVLKAFDASRADVTVVGVALDDADRVMAYVSDMEIAYPILLDTPGAGDFSVFLGNDRGVLPYTALVGPDRRLLATHLGEFEDEAELGAWIASASD